METHRQRLAVGLNETSETPGLSQRTTENYIRAKAIRARLFGLAREIKSRAESGREPAIQIIEDALAALGAMRVEYDLARTGIEDDR